MPKCRGIFITNVSYPVVLSRAVSASRLSSRRLRKQKRGSGHISFPCVYHSCIYAQHISVTYIRSYFVPSRIFFISIISVLRTRFFVLLDVHHEASWNTRRNCHTHDQPTRSRHWFEFLPCPASSYTASSSLSLPLYLASCWY